MLIGWWMRESNIAVLEGLKKYLPKDTEREIRNVRLKEAFVLFKENNMGA